jgi:hypothetical protein
MPAHRLGARAGAFTLNDRRTYLYDGELHYFRVRPALWRPGLEHLRAAGMNAVSTYIPWVWHEPDEGVFDFTGRTRPARDLAGFLEQARAVGLAVMARPGPLIYAEFDGLGIPLWLGDRYPETVVVQRDGRRGRGEFFWNHCLMHPVYRARVRSWYEAVARFLEPYWNDPVISFQLDNETGLLFANQVGRIDFNPDTIGRYREFLRTRYSTIDDLNERWSTAHAGFETVLPPRPPLRQAEIADWQWFLETWIDDYLSWLAEVARECGVPVPLVHNEQGLQHSPLHAQGRAATIDYVGYDIYPKASPARHTADFPFGASLYPGMFSSYQAPDRPVLALEIGTGWFDPRAHVSDAAVVQSIFGGLAHGARGLCLFTTHDGREPTGEPYDFGAPLDEFGRPTGRYRVVSGVGRFLERWGDALLDTTEVHDPVGFGIYFPNFRFDSADYFRGTDQIDPHRYLTFLAQGGMHALLLAAGLNPQVVDIRELHAKPLAELQMLLFPTPGLIEPELYVKLEDYVLGGGHLVTAPGPVDRDLWGHEAPYRKLYPLRAAHEERLDVKRVWGTILLAGVPYWLFQRPWLSDRHRSSAHIIDLYEPLLASLRTPVRGRRFEYRPFAAPGAGAASPPESWPILGDFVSRTFEVPADPEGETGIRPGPLWHAGRPAAYEVALGWGSSTVLGTLPAGRYLTPRYYAVAPAERRALRRLVRTLLAQRGIAPHFDTDLEVELAAHAGEGGGFLFVINRLGRQEGEVRMRDPDAVGFGGRLEVAYSFAGSTARVIDARTLELDLAADDVLVLRFD